MLDARPTHLIGVDPDSRSTAIARAIFDGKRYVFVEALGGGERLGSWQDSLGVVEYLRELDGPACVAVETQAPKGPQSQHVEALRRVRYHWEAVCLIVGARCLFVAPSQWQGLFVGQVRGAGATKAAYRSRARELTPQATNEDRAAAVGMLCWAAHQLGEPLYFGDDLWTPRG